MDGATTVHGAWVAGYRAALRDMEVLIHSRGLDTRPIADLFLDLYGDMHVIKHELDHHALRQKLRQIVRTRTAGRARNARASQGASR